MLPESHFYPIELWCLPWAGLSSSYAFSNDVIIEPIESFIKWSGHNQRQKTALLTYRNLFRNVVGAVHPGVCVVHDRMANAVNYNDIQKSKFRNAIDSLMFSAVAPSITELAKNGNLLHRHYTADQFMLFDHLIQEHAAQFDAGSLTMSTSFDILKFSLPVYLLDSTTTVDERIFLALSAAHCKLSKVEKPWLFQSLHWFNLAHSSSQQMSEWVRVNMMNIAFESLLKFHSSVGEDKISKVSRLCAIPNMKQYVHIHKNKSSVLSPIGKWFDSFRELRNNITHGNELTNQDLLYRGAASRSTSHLFVADLVFWHLLLVTLETLNCLDSAPEALHTAFEIEETYKSFAWFENKCS